MAFLGKPETSKQRRRRVHKSHRANTGKAMGSFFTRGKGRPTAKRRRTR